MTTPTSHGVVSKIARAKEHVEELKRNIEEFSKSQTGTVTHHFDSETSEHTWVLDSDLPAIQYRIHVIVGDILYNLRSALDHLVWQLVLSNGGTPTDRTAFPIFHDPAKYKKAGQRRMEGVSDEVKAIIDSVQPCNGGDWNLHTLEVLSNIDKHRHLSIVNITVQAVETGTPIRIDPKQTITININRERAVRGTELIRLVHEDVNVNLKPVFGIAFGEGTAAQSEEITTVLVGLGVSVINTYNSLYTHIHQPPSTEMG